MVQNIAKKKQNTKNLNNSINIYDDWSADGSVNNMTIRDLIINYVTYGTWKRTLDPIVKLQMFN